MSNSFQIYQILRRIAENAYPESTIQNFRVEVYAKEMNTRHGDYMPSERKIRIFNISRPDDYLISTCIHELAHHVEFSLYRDTGHSKRFYEVYKKLLETAVMMGVIDYSKARTVQDARDLRQLEKHYGEIKAVYQPSMDEKINKCIIKVYNCFSVKETLKKYGYFYSPLECCWSKELNKSEIETESAFLNNLNPKIKFIVRAANKLQIDAIYYIIVKNGYDMKNNLKINGYIFNGYQRSGDVWVKKINASELNSEKQMLKQFKGIEYKIEGNKSV